MVHPIVERGDFAYYLRVNVLDYIVIPSLELLVFIPSPGKHCHSLGGLDAVLSIDHPELPACDFLKGLGPLK